jgi:hypothetical protein
MSIEIITRPLVASELVNEGSCSPQCMHAREPDGCACKCAGQFHGSLRNAEVLPSTGRRPVRAEA